MPKSKRVATAESIRQSARQAGLLLSEERIQELVPMLQTVLDATEELRELVRKRNVEPALTFRAMWD